MLRLHFVLGNAYFMFMLIKITGIRMLDQPFMTDIIEASSISHMPQVIDIYSASWGPTDNGKTVDGPRELTLQAMADGVNKVMILIIWVLGQNGVYMLVLKPVTWEHNAVAQIIQLSAYFKFL